MYIQEFPKSTMLIIVFHSINNLHQFNVHSTKVTRNTQENNQNHWNLHNNVYALTYG